MAEKKTISADAMLANHEARIKVCEKRLNKFDKLAESINDLALSVKEIAVNQTAMLNDMKEEKETRKTNEKRITALELQPAKNAQEIRQKVIIAIITGCIGAIVGAIMGLLLK